MQYSSLSTELDPERTALFFDCDGTLSALAEHPQMACVEPWLLERLAVLADRSGGALAVVSGRSIAQLDAMLAPLALPVAGVHGLERRDHAGRVHRAGIDAGLIADLARRAGEFTQQVPGLVCEEKPGAVALHYRMRPDMERAVAEFAAEMARGRPGLRLLAGKMVVEIGFASRNKGDAIAAFMRERPFAGRLPVFAGDDVTDEDGFATVTAMGGLAVKVGDGGTSASLRVAGLQDLHRWIDALAARWSALATRREQGALDSAR